MAYDRLRSSPRRGTQPYYAILALFAASCFVGALATDVAYWWTANTMWVDFSDWLVTAGVIVGYLALLVALIEVFALRSPRRPTWAYAIGTIAALVLATFDMLVHTRDAWTSVVPWGLVLSAAVVIVLLATGWLTRDTYEVAGAEVTT
jgi:uncharacterized membrane protein